MPNRDPVPRPRYCSSRRGSQMDDGAVPYFGAKGMVGQTIGPFARLIGGILFSGDERCRVQGALSIWWQHLVGDVVDEGMFERIFKVRKQSDLVEHFTGLQASERLPN